jgi:hypothetical protein
MALPLGVVLDFVENSKYAAIERLRNTDLKGQIAVFEAIMAKTPECCDEEVEEDVIEL